MSHIVYAATPNHHGDPELDAYGPFADRDAADQFADRLYRVHIERGECTDIYVDDDLGVTSPDEHFMNDPEYLDDDGEDA